MNECVYCIMEGDIIAMICKSEADAQELCMDLHFENLYYSWLYAINIWGDNPNEEWEILIPSAEFEVYYVDKFPLI